MSEKFPPRFVVGGWDWRGYRLKQDDMIQISARLPYDEEEIKIHEFIVMSVAEHEALMDEAMAKCPNEEWECTKIQRRLEAELSALRSDLERMEKIQKLATSVTNCWYRNPPVAEGGDFLADMFKLREALADGCAEPKGE